MTTRRYKVKERLKKYRKVLKGVSGKTRTLIEIGGKPSKLPKKIRAGLKETYRRLHRE